MEAQFISRNHDMGMAFPTFQERVNSMLPVDSSAQAAPVLESNHKKGMTPHYPTQDEIAQTLQDVEREATEQSEELLQMHSGLNEQRVARLLGLLD